MSETLYECHKVLVLTRDEAGAISRFTAEMASHPNPWTHAQVKRYEITGSARLLDRGGYEAEPDDGQSACDQELRLIAGALSDEDQQSLEDLLAGRSA
jgi:hypothetical protein